MTDYEKMLDNLLGKVASSKEVEKDLRRELAGLPGHWTTVSSNDCGTIHHSRDVLGELEWQQQVTTRLQAQVAIFKDMKEQCQ